MLLLALRTLPLPWLEVRCVSHENDTGYSQTGLQVLGNRCTNLTTAPPQSSWAGRPLRAVVGWWWVLVVIAAVGLGLFGGLFVPALLNLMLSCISTGLFLTLLAGVIVSELPFRSVTFSLVPYVTLLACAVAAGLSAISFARLNRSPPVVDP